jgi:hypothetical protein
LFREPPIAKPEVLKKLILDRDWPITHIGCFEPGYLPRHCDVRLCSRDFERDFCPGSPPGFFTRLFAVEQPLLNTRDFPAEIWLVTGAQSKSRREVAQPEVNKAKT